ncbi:MAG: methyltransferase domain-containing protein [Bacteroidetes bacterium]|nr:methyltransferase domain-containing protein [Bacteroidota bacterium]
MNNTAIAFSGNIPEKYDTYLGPMLFEPYAVDIASRIHIGYKQASILELACGTGRVTKHLRSSLPSSVQVFATDFNADMLDVAKNKNHGQKIEWGLADAQDLPFQDGNFDVVVCQFGFMFVPDKAKAFAEAFRVLKKGGTIIFSTWDSLANNHLFDMANNIVSGYFPETPPIFYHIPFSLFDTKELDALVRSAGFSDIKIELLKKEAVSPSAKDAAIGMVEGNPMQRFILEKNPSLFDTIRNDVEKQIGSQFGDRPLKASMQAWIVEANKK